MTGKMAVGATRNGYLYPSKHLRAVAAFLYNCQPFLPHVKTMHACIPLQCKLGIPFLSVIPFSHTCSPIFVCLQIRTILEEEVQTIAKQITRRCLRRWGSFLAIRAGKDSLGRRPGIWKDKFDGVRSAALLLAYQTVNAKLQQEMVNAATRGIPDPPGVPI